MTYSKHSLLITLLLTLFCLSNCEKDKLNFSDDITLTESINKIETSYKEGDIKIENIITDNKVETEADFSLKEKIRLELDRSYSKNQTYLKSSNNLVGVFKYGSCGSWGELKVFMDCEDHNSQSKSIGTTGQSYADYNGNVHLNYCVVPATYFQHSDVSYAVLNLTSDLPWGVSRIRRYFDNEDNNNTNSATYNGVEYSGWAGNCYFGSNTLLSFYYYPETTTFSHPPSLGIMYGVLGHFGLANGYIYCDDEDNGNENWCYVDLFIDSKYISGYSGNIINIMEVGSNTRLYMCQYGTIRI